MKPYLFAFILFLAYPVFGQTEISKVIDSSNYYDFYFYSPSKLTKQKIICAELKKAGYDSIYENSLFKLSNGKTIQLAGYSKKENVGFLYSESSSSLPIKKDRAILFRKNYASSNYGVYVTIDSNKLGIVMLSELPHTIFLLKKSCYFYQYSDNPKDNNSLVTKEIATNILKQDIKKYLQGISK